MSREIHWNCYPGGMSVVLQVETFSSSRWPVTSVIPVAFLWSPTIKTHGIWEERSSELTPSEKDMIERQAREYLRRWVRWSIDPNRELIKNPKTLEERVDAIMSCVPEDYKILHKTFK